MRPNIRVEIQNNLVEDMEVDENEEGEISDHDDSEAPEKHGQIQFKDSIMTSPSAFTSSTAIVDKIDEAKLQERAKRFCLNPEEIKNFKDEDLQLLHSSLGITSANESNVCFEVIHMRGIDQMTAGDILDYFLEYAPISVEWIDEESCNVVWKDGVSTARALHFISKAVKGMPVRDDSSYFDPVQEEVDQSILVINKNREIELTEDSEEPPNKLFNEQNSVDISQITATIPPGYWRLGNNHPKSKCLLMRFALKTDKKPVKVEQFSRYYKNQGKKIAKHETHGIFGRNKDMHKTNENPWTVLAKNWDEDRQFREKERSQEAEEREVKNQSLRNRLGMKRKEEPKAEPEEEEGEEEQEEEEVPKKKIKIPRMRMYADEEEEKIKRKKMLQRINNQIKKIDQDKSTNSDLRTILNMTSRTHGVKLEKAEPEVFDLGSRLKNRNKKMVFQIKSENVDEDEVRQPHYKSHRDRDRFHRRKHYSSEDEEVRYNRREEDSHGKPKSKVAVVIKTQKKPTVASAVASTVWSRVSEREKSENESESESESEQSSQNESEAEEFVERKITNRPGFTARGKDQSLSHPAYKNPLKIEISNDHFKKS